MHVICKMAAKEFTPCPWHGHQLHGAAGIPQQPLGCNRLQSGEEWSVGPPNPGSLRSEGCTVAAAHRDNMTIDYMWFILLQKTIKIVVTCKPPLFLVKM